MIIIFYFSFALQSMGIFLKLQSFLDKYNCHSRSQFTKVHDLTTQDFIEAVDNVDVHVTVIIHIYEVFFLFIFLLSISVKFSKQSVC